MTDHKRAPQAFVLEDDKIVSQQSKGRKKSSAEITFDEEVTDLPLVVAPGTYQPVPQRQMPWLGLLLSSVLALIVMWAGLTATAMIEDAFARTPWLGWAALSAAGVAGFAALAIVAREIWGLASLRRIEHIQDQASRAINLDETAAADAALAEMTKLYAARPEMALQLKEWRAHARDIMDPRDRVRLADRILLAPLDEEAHRIIARRAQRVTLLTTVTPAAALDILFVAAQNAGMLREIAALYGGKPSTIATLRLGRMVVTHLAVTGGLALSDSLIQHIVGRGLLGRLSARFGEGAVNGILTCRIGLAAKDVCRPVPLAAQARETLASLLRELVSFGPKDKSDDARES